MKKDPERLFSKLITTDGLAPAKAGTAKEWRELAGWYREQYAHLALAALRKGGVNQNLKKAVDTAIAMGGGEEAQA